MRARQATDGRDWLFALILWGLGCWGLYLVWDWINGLSDGFVYYALKIAWALAATAFFFAPLFLKHWITAFFRHYEDRL